MTKYILSWLNHSIIIQYIKSIFQFLSIYADQNLLFFKNITSISIIIIYNY